MSQQNYPEASMRDFYNVLFRNKRKILVFFFSVMVVVTLGTLFVPEVYQSEAELMVRLGRESVSPGSHRDHRPGGKYRLRA